MRGWRIDLTGQRFGKLTVIEQAGHSRCGSARWLCLCDCGKSNIIQSNNLRSGQTQSCGCIKQNRKPRSLIGQRFGKLIVMKNAGNNASAQPQWLCQCDCGKSHVVSGQSLKTGDTQSCGCLRSEVKRKRTINAMELSSGLYEMYSRYIYGAIKRGYEFTLTPAEFLAIVKQPCAYCGAAPTDRGTHIVANGVDRVDNARGYLPGNVAPCCTACNSAKRTMSVDEYIDLCTRVAQHAKQEVL